MQLEGKFLTALAMISLLCLFISCSSGGGGGDGSVGSGGSGTLSLSLTDATTLEYRAVYVTIERVDVHLGADENSSNNWETVARPARTYNLLELVNGVRKQLGIAELTAGHYTQMRLIIGTNPDNSLNILSTPHPHPNYIILAGTNEIHELFVPSGVQTGIKLVHGFKINPNQTTELILDFDAARSVVKAGNNPIHPYILKPTIKVLKAEDNSLVSGAVVDDDGVFLTGVLISAQIFQPDLFDRKDQVVTWTSTITDEQGHYKLFLKPGTYNIVAFATGYVPEAACSLALGSGDVVEGLDFELRLASTGAISGDVIIAGASQDQYATISFRQFVDCDNDGTAETEIEANSVNVTNGGFYSITLPVGFYDVVASSYEKDTVSLEDVEVFEDSQLEYPIKM